MLFQGHMDAPVYRSTGQVVPRFWEFRVAVEWEWCHSIMVEADIHFWLLPTSILNKYKVMLLTYRICFINLPIPVMGPEGPSLSLVFSLELAFYEISVASQKNVIFVFLELFIYLVFCCLFYIVLLRTFIGFKSGIMTCQLPVVVIRWIS
jgi:hypothetical protein